MQNSGVGPHPVASYEAVTVIQFGQRKGNYLCGNGGGFMVIRDTSWRWVAVAWSVKSCCLAKAN